MADAQIKFFLKKTQSCKIKTQKLKKFHMYLKRVLVDRSRELGTYKYNILKLDVKCNRLQEERNPEI